MCAKQVVELLGVAESNPLKFIWLMRKVFIEMVRSHSVLLCLLPNLSTEEREMKSDIHLMDIIDARTSQ